MFIDPVFVTSDIGVAVVELPDTVPCANDTAKVVPVVDGIDWT